MGDITQFGSITGGKAQPEKEKLPANNYVLTDINDDEYYARGFMIFTSQHVAVMEDTDSGAVPVIVLPLNQLKVAERATDEQVKEYDLPF